jgi:hypothetical protein
MFLACLDSQGISSFDYAQNRGLYFCRSVFEVYLRDKRNESVNSQPLTSFAVNNPDSTLLNNGAGIRPMPPSNGQAKFVRSNGRRSLTDSSPQPYLLSSTLSLDSVSRGQQPSNSSANRHQKIRSNDHADEYHEQHDANNDNETNESKRNGRYRPMSSSTTNSSTRAPPIKPRKNSTTPTGLLENASKLPQRRQHPHSYVSMQAERNKHKSDDDDDDDDGANSLDGHGDGSDLDENQSMRQERPNSRLSVHHSNDPVPVSFSAHLRRPQYKTSRQANRHSMYDDYQYLDEQQHASGSTLTTKSKQHARSVSTKELGNLAGNRISSGNGSQLINDRLKSSSKSNSNESIPALDLTVAGQKLFRTKQRADGSLSFSQPTANIVRPPSGRLKPISSAKSTSSYSEELSSTSTRTLDDVTNNGKLVALPQPKTQLYKKKLVPLINSNENVNRKGSVRSTIVSASSMIDDAALSDRSEDNNSGSSNVGDSGRTTTGREFRSSTGSDKRSRYH